MAHSQAINQKTTDIYLLCWQGGGRKYNFLILKEPWGLNEECSDHKRWGKNKCCRIRENSGSQCGGPCGFSSVNRLVIPRICVPSAVVFTHWFLARVKCLHMTLVNADITSLGLIKSRTCPPIHLCQTSRSSQPRSPRATIFLPMEAKLSSSAN